MSLKNKGIDLYSWRTRLKPALLVGLPAGLIIVAFFPDASIAGNTTWGLITWAGGTLLLSQIGRDSGKRKEKQLFANWGGKPTTRMLRHRDAENKVLLERYHDKLNNLLKNIRIPSEKEEQESPARADDIYESCVAFLRERTRNRKEFYLVYEENCNYGFRRNLWGMKLFGILTSTTGVLVAGWLLMRGESFGYTSPSPATITCLIGNLLLLLGWLFWFTPGWVKVAADAYSKQLLASCENL